MDIHVHCDIRVLLLTGSGLFTLVGYLVTENTMNEAEKHRRPSLKLLE